MRTKGTKRAARSAWLVVVAGLTLAGSSARPAEAMTVEHSRHEGVFVDGIFRTETATTGTDVNVQILAGHLKGPQVDDGLNFLYFLRAKAPAVLLVIVQSDLSTGAELLGAYRYETVPTKDVTIDPQLRWARVRTTVTATNWSTGETFPVSIDMTWTANGRLFKWAVATMERWCTIDPQSCTRRPSETRPIHEVIHETGRQRTFESASGTVMMGSTNLTPATGDGWVTREEFFITRTTR